jgi:Tfp pilus assembly protein FimT
MAQVSTHSYGVGNGGFTLIRLLVTIGISGVMLAAASPNIATVTRVYAVRSAARQVYSELQNARMAAVMENSTHTFAVCTGGATYIAYKGTGSDCGTQTPQPLEAQGITMAAANAITFAANGTAATTGTVTVSNTFGDNVQVIVGSAGRVYIP